jgi:dTDP-4-dehydrorhamnose 3,5-epimerase
MDCAKTPLPGAVLLTPRRFGDERGWFSEVWNARTLQAAGIGIVFVQDNHSYSKPKGTLRGLHYQAPPHAQAKLVRCTAGAVWDVAVDVREGSPTYKHWFGTELSARNGVQFLIPAGFLHGFLTLTDDAEVQYKCSDYYDRDADGAVGWDSAELGIDWPLDGAPVLSEKDAAAPDFSDWQTPFGPDGSARA